MLYIIPKRGFCTIPYVFVADFIVILDSVVKCVYSLVVKPTAGIIIVEDADPVDAVKGSQEHILGTLVDHGEELCYRVV